MSDQHFISVRDAGRIADLNELILRSIVDHAVVTMNPDGIITSWNEGAERILGWTDEEILGQHADAFFTSVDTADHRVEVEMKLALEHGRAEDVRWHVRKGGEKFWGSGLMMPLLDATDAEGDAVRKPGRLAGFVKIFRDQTKEREAERRMQRLQDRARIAMNRSGTVGVFENELQKDVVIADEIAARLHRVDVATAEGGTSVEAFFRGILFEDRDCVRQAIRAAATKGDNVDITYRVTREGTKPVWVQAQGTVQFDDAGTPERLVGIVVDVTDHREQMRMQQTRLEFSERVRDLRDPSEIANLAARMIAETIHVFRSGHGVVDPTGKIVTVKADWTRDGGLSLLGDHRFEDFGSYVADLREGRAVIIEDVRADPRVQDVKPLENLGVRSLVNLPLMQEGQLKAVLFVNSQVPRKWTENELAFLSAMVDRTYAAMDRLRLENERDVLANEIAHRMKNVLTMAQIIVRQSLRGVAGIEDEKHAIQLRLSALSAAQDVLTQSQQKEVDIHAVVRSALGPHVADLRQIAISGPAMRLASEQVIGLTLALHELATNAAKYGALSTENGWVTINWSLTGNDFTFEWKEGGGPAVSSPRGQGFGSTLLNGVVGSYFQGISRLELLDDGAEFTLVGSRPH
ncbi:PAS domain-containing sensor histidine kinase [Paracoccus sediminilitoris]|uniref:PAS domain-containing sensor histidine kinase n=1 Tax=Paracoccus sediminilitoris TaxID=2202419 RepID=UPI0013145A2B|nr:HWE histidine kinase domain-containing protein [Paracoccus sediminilitoris]